MRGSIILENQDNQTIPLIRTGNLMQTRSAAPPIRPGCPNKWTTLVTIIFFNWEILFYFVLHFVMECFLTKESL